MSADAREILATCTRATSRPLIAWAAGSLDAGHASGVLALLAGRQSREMGGRSLGDGRWLNRGRDGISIIPPYGVDDDEPSPLLTVTWEEVAAPLDRVPADLLAEMHAALRVRRDRWTAAHPWPPALIRDWHTPQAQEADRLWSEIEAHCAELGARAWASCRPPDHEEPRDLLELLESLAVSA